MSSIKKLTKKTLVELANDLGISNQLSEKTDLKQDYVEKIEQFANANPNAASIIQKHVQLFKTKSPSKKSTSNGSDVVNVESSSSSSAASSQPSSDEEVDVEKDTEKIEDDSEVGFDFKTYLQKINDKTTDVYETTVDNISDSIGKIVDFGYEKSDLLREASSSPFTITFLETFTQFSYLYLHYLDFTTIGKSKIVPKLFKDNLPHKALSFPILDFNEFWKYNSINVFTLWLFISFLFPLVVSYYFNFTKPTKRSAYKYTFDPFIFTLTKFLSILFVLKSEISLHSVKDDIVYKAAGGSIFHFIQSFFLDGEFQLRLLFGPITLISSVVTTLIAFYAVVGK